MDLVDELLADLRRDGAARHKMFAAVDLAGFAKDDGAALADDQVAGLAEGRVGGDAGPAIGAAALEGDDEFGGRDWLALGPVRLGQQVHHGLDSRLDGLEESAILLDGQHRGLVTVGEVANVDDVLGLVGFAAETHNDITANIRMIDDARHGSLQQVQVVGTVVGPAAALGGEGDDAVDVGVLVEHRIVAEVVGHPSHGGGRAVHGGQQGDEVPGAHAAIGPPVAHEGAALGFRHVLDRDHVLAETVVEFQFPLMHFQVVGVYVLAGGDVL